MVNTYIQLHIVRVSLNLKILLRFISSIYRSLYQTSCLYSKTQRIMDIGIRYCSHILLNFFHS